jgi:predicted lipoprotein with Yx(FWY)xxD motif
MKKQPPFFKLPFYVVPVIILLFVSVVFKSCSKSTTPDKINSVQLATDPVLGTILTDSKGYTLYYFSIDIDGGINKCTGGCLAVWPIFYDSLLSTSTLGSGLNVSDFTTITTNLGTKQTAYKGWPLYYYAPKDATSGANVRELPGVKGGEKVGNVWFVVKTNYSIMLGDKKVVASGTTDSTTKEFLTDSAGNTLYYFVKDSLNPTTLPTNCIAGCITTWPVFYSPNLNLPTLLAKADFGTITRTDGTGGTNRLQSTYKGRPLYYYTPDAFVRGAAKGEGVGKNWFVVKPDILKIN